MPSQSGGMQALLFPIDEPDPVAIGAAAAPGDLRTSFSTQTPGMIVFDGSVYRYTGLVLDVTMEEPECYRRISCVCTPEGIGVDPVCEPDRVRSMLDAVGASRQRQREIRVYGKRPWHSPWRPEPACEQALDWAFSHDVPLVAMLVPAVAPLFREDPVTADTWIRDLKQAYRTRRFEPARLRQVLERVCLSPECLTAFFQASG